jgi:hypothetical protein
MGGVFPWICAQPGQKAGSRQMRNRVLMAQSEIVCAHGGVGRARLTPAEFP